MMNATEAFKLSSSNPLNPDQTDFPDPNPVLVGLEDKIRYAAFCGEFSVGINILSYFDITSLEKWCRHNSTSNHKFICETVSFGGKLMPVEISWKPINKNG